jgi:hypothetical protein
VFKKNAWEMISETTNLNIDTLREATFVKVNYNRAGVDTTIGGRRHNFRR